MLLHFVVAILAIHNGYLKMKCLKTFELFLVSLTGLIPQESYSK